MKKLLDYLIKLKNLEDPFLMDLIEKYQVVDQTHIK